MMDRRSFLRRTAVLAAAVAVLPSMLTDGPKPLFGAPALRDDTPMLQAMLDRGEPIVNGAFTLRSDLVLRRGSVVRGCSLVFYGNARFYIPGPANFPETIVEDNCFENPDYGCCMIQDGSAILMASLPTVQ